jgi:hypothetical protein
MLIRSLSCVLVLVVPLSGNVTAQDKKPAKVRVLLLGDSTVTAPRFGTNHHLGPFRQTPPQLGSLILYPDFGKKTFDDLAARGHKISRPKAHLWNPSVITIDHQSGVIRAAGDPKAKRHAAAY